MFGYVVLPLPLKRADLSPLVNSIFLIPRVNDTLTRPTHRPESISHVLPLRLAELPVRTTVRIRPAESAYEKLNVVRGLMNG